MQTCTRCHQPSSDTLATCVHCGAVFAEFSQTAVALARLRANPRVNEVRLIVDAEACPACCAAEGNFTKADVPSLPVEGCSHPNGCRCFYSPALNDIFP